MLEGIICAIHTHFCLKLTASIQQNDLWVSHRKPLQLQVKKSTEYLDAVGMGERE